MAIIRADARALPLVDGCVDCVVTSPPYWGLRDYGSDDQIGIEPTPEAYVQSILAVFSELARVLKPTGTIWLNLGDTYAGARGQALRGGPPSSFSTLEGNGHRGGGPSLRAMTTSRRRDRVAIPRSDMAVPGCKPKDLVGIPWRVALALQALGWYLRSDVIWHKSNPMPESVTDRPTRAHEYLFLLTKSERYYYDAKAIQEPATGLRSGNTEPYRVDGERSGPNANKGGSLHMIGARVVRNKRDVWTIPTMAYAGAHFATMPEKLVEPCILAGCPLGGLVFDPFLGSGTVAAVAARLGRRGVGTDLSYQHLSRARTAQRGLGLAEGIA